MSKTHKNLILTPSDRRPMVDCVLVKKMKQYVKEAMFNLHPRTVKKWLRRFKEEGESGVEDSSSCRFTHPNATPPEKVKEIITKRKEGKMTGEMSIPQRTVSRPLIEAQLFRQKDIEPRDEDLLQRYEDEAPRDKIRLDIKTLRNVNEEGNRKEEAGNRPKSANKTSGTVRTRTYSMHVAVDDHSS